MSGEIYLHYEGFGSWLPDVPAKDLTKEEAEYYGVGRLLDTGLYKKVKGQTYPSFDNVQSRPLNRPMEKKGK